MEKLILKIKILDIITFKMTELLEYITYLDEMNPVDDDYMDVDDEQEFYEYIEEFEYLSEDELCVE
jgi:hypothetical protein